MKRLLALLLIALLLLSGCTDSETFSMRVDPETGTATCMQE